MARNVMSFVTAVCLLLISCAGEKKPVESKPAQAAPETTVTPSKPDTISNLATEKLAKPTVDVKKASVPKEVTLVGELVDLVSFISSGAKQSPEAIRKSAQVGNPIGFFEPTTKRIFVVGLPKINSGANARLLPYVGMRVFLVGKTYTRNGVDVIVMSDIGKSIK